MNTTWNEASNKLTKEFEFPDFKTALEFVNKVGEIAEEQGHHPEIYLTWGKVKIETYTHDTNSITEKDEKLTKAVDEL